jgi:hypothetical protein
MLGFRCKTPRIAVSQAMENDDEDAGWEVLFLGDSIFEPWRGTKMDQSWAAYADIPPTWESSFGRTYGRAAHVLAISGATCASLLSGGYLHTRCNLWLFTYQVAICICIIRCNPWLFTYQVFVYISGATCGYLHIR